MGLRGEVRRHSRARDAAGGSSGEAVVADAAGVDGRVSRDGGRGRSASRRHADPRRGARVPRQKGRVALSAAAEARRYWRRRPALRRVRPSDARRPLDHGSPARGAARRPRSPCRLAAGEGLPLAAPRSRRKGGLSRGEAAGLGRGHRQGRTLGLRAEHTVTLMAQDQGPQRIRVRDRRIHEAERRAPAFWRASRRAL